MNKLLARTLCTAFIIAPIPVLAYAAPAIAQQMQRPDNPKEPRGDGCIPIGVTKTPNGIVYADEDCHGKIYRRRMSD